MTLRGRQLLSPITDSNKQFCQASQASTAEPTQPYSTQQTVFRRVLATDPAATAALWAKVRRAMPPKKQVTKNNKDNDRERGGRGRGRGRGRGQTTITKVTSRNPHFQSLVLRPRKIVAEKNNETNKSSYSHFKTTAPSKGNLLDYTAIKGLDAADVWLSLSDDQVKQIIEEYEFMSNKEVCEQEYASFTTETFLRRQRRFIRTPIDRKWRAERMLQLIAPPTEDSMRSCWVAPPSFEESLKFKFDLRPDCSYWLSLTGFNSEYRGELRSAVYVHDGDWITCPYFTIEFKKYGQSINQATWQACAAASIPLYNRYLLKRKALAVRAGEWTDFDRAQMKHYILTFVGSEYDIWVLRARFSEDSSAWDGCSMTNICHSTCTSKTGVRRLESWINEIHRWGLSVHAAGCQADVKTILEQNDIDISAIDLEVGE